MCSSHRYCLGERVDCETLLARLENGAVARPPGDWRDAAMEGAVHSCLSGPVATTPATTSPRPTPADADVELGNPLRAGATTTPVLGGEASEVEASEVDRVVSPVLGGEASEREKSPAPGPAPPEDCHVFAFGFGCVVLWGFARRAERDVVASLFEDASVSSGATTSAERVEAHDTMASLSPARSFR